MLTRYCVVDIITSTTTQRDKTMTSVKGYESNDSASFNENDGALFDEQHEPHHSDFHQHTHEYRLARG